VRLNKIEGLKPLLPNRKYGQKWEALEFGISAQSFLKKIYMLAKAVKDLRIRTKAIAPQAFF